MIDFKKHRFCAAVTEHIAENPNWAGDAINAITAGVVQAIDKQNRATGEMAAVLIWFYLQNQRGQRVSEADRLRAIELLAKYFNVDTLKNKI